MAAVEPAAAGMCRPAVDTGTDNITHLYMLETLEHAGPHNLVRDALVLQGWRTAVQQYSKECVEMSRKERRKEKEKKKDSKEKKQQ